MGTVARYRDLPGGPTDIEMGEEISRHSLCTQCGMLSMCISQDRQGHVFCFACIEERRKQRQQHIFCKYEQKDVTLDEMAQANEVVTVIQDQFTICPNQQCRKTMRLEALHDHFLQCTPRVQCPTCFQQIQSREWNKHCKTHCLGRLQDNSQKGRRDNFTKRTNQNQSTVDHSPKTAVPQQKKALNSTSSSSRFTGSNPHYNTQSGSGALNISAPVSPSPRSQLSSSSSLSPQPQPIQKSRRTGEYSISDCKLCEFCNRPVKNINTLRHRQTCAKAPKVCVYCEKSIWDQEMAASGAQGDTCTNPGRAKPVSNPLEPRGADFEARGRTSLEATLPELPTLALSKADMKTWHDAFEQHLSMLGINDNTLKYEVLVSTLSPEVLTQVERTKWPLPPGREYDCLLKALFALSESARKKSSDCQADESLSDKPATKALQWTEFLHDYFVNVKDGFSEAHSQSDSYEVVTGYVERDCMSVNS